MLLAVAGNQPIVSLVHEPRPYTTLPGILVLAGFAVGVALALLGHRIARRSISAGLGWLDRAWLWPLRPRPGAAADEAAARL